MRVTRGARGARGRGNEEERGDAGPLVTNSSIQCHLMSLLSHLETVDLTMYTRRESSTI